MDDILAAAAKLQLQYKQLQDRNKKFESELADKAEKQKATDRLIEKQEKYLSTLEDQVELVEAALAEKQKFASELRVRAGTKVKLDVGGIYFTTSVTTLLSEPDSMLAAMFSGRHELEKDDDDRVFIDRDGKLFKYVIQYLRDGDLDVSELSSGVKKRLRREAAFYCLPKLEEKLSTAAPTGSLPNRVHLLVEVARKDVEIRITYIERVISHEIAIAGPDPLALHSRLPERSLKPCKKGGQWALEETLGSFMYNRWLPALFDGYGQAGYSLVKDTLAPEHISGFGTFSFNLSFEKQGF
jgi:hypothetical protein